MQHGGSCGVTPTILLATFTLVISNLLRWAVSLWIVRLPSHTVWSSSFRVPRQTCITETRNRWKGKTWTKKTAFSFRKHTEVIVHERIVLNSNVTGVVNAWDHRRFSNEKNKRKDLGMDKVQWIWPCVINTVTRKWSSTLHTYVFTVNLFHINYSYVYFSSNFPSTLTHSRVVHVAVWFLRKYRVWEKKKEDNRSLCGLCESEPTQRRYSKNLVRIARLQNRCDRWTSVSSVLT